LVDAQGRWRLDGPIVWILDFVQRLEAFEYRIACIVDHWLDRIIGGFVTEFAVDTSVSYNKEE